MSSTVRAGTMALLLALLSLSYPFPGSLRAQEPGFRIEFRSESGLSGAGTLSARVAEALGHAESVHVDMNPPHFEVWVGDFASRDDAKAVVDFLRRQGLTGGRIIRNPEWRVPGSRGVTIHPAASPPQAAPARNPSQTAVAHKPVANPVEIGWPDELGLSMAATRSGLGSVEVVPSQSIPPRPVDVLPLVRPLATGAETNEYRSRPDLPAPTSVPRPGTPPTDTDPEPVADTSANRPQVPEPPDESQVATRQETSGPGAPSRYRGFHDDATCTVTFGWAYNPDAPDERPLVEIYDGDRRLGEVIADVYRADLEAAGIGDGRYGFRFTHSGDSADGPVALEARVRGSALPLRGSPRPNPCRATETGEPPSASRDSADEATSDAPPAADATSSGREASDERGAETASAGARKSMFAQSVSAGDIVLDGVLGETAWVAATFTEDLEQKGLNRGFSRPPWTRIAVLYDDEALYVGARMEGPGSENIDTRVTLRDDGGNVDRLLVSLDTRGDRRTAYTFGVTAGGVRLDHYHPEDREFPRDDRFDPVWETRTTADSTGWTAEMRIPFSQLRFDDGPVQSWGINVRRWNPQALMNHYWVVVPMEEQGWASRFGELRGLEDLDRGRRVEIAPYLLQGVSRPTGPDANAAPEGESTLRVGGDLKVGLGPDLTLDATVRPDFGQVEADPAEVNLSAFETAFEERRPFFTEGASLLKGRGPRYFYSRRIGAVPHGTDPGNAIDPPLNTDILGAAKLTGRTSSGLSVGGLFAVTPRVSTPTDEGGGIRGVTVVAPATTFGVGRVEREVGGPGSVVGLTLTGVYRSLEQGSVPESVLSRQAVAGGGDWNLRFGQGRYEVAGHVGFSHLVAEPAAMALIQRSSVHYFQRPDADHVSFDPTRTSLSGYTGSVSVSKVVGTAWTWSVGAGTESPGFNIRDAGIIRSADHRDLFATVGYRKVTPGRLFRHYAITAQADASWNYGGVRQFLSPSLTLSGALLSFVRPFVQLAYEAPTLSDELTRGGPLMGAPSAVQVNAGLAAPFASRTQWSISGGYRQDEFGGSRYDINAGAAMRAGSHVELSLYPGYSRGVDTRQYYGFLPGGPESTFGRREIFSRLETSELYAQARVDVSVTPDISFHLYAEPFASSGAYADYGELVGAGESDLETYGNGNSTVEPGDYGSVLVRKDGTAFTLWPTPFNVRSFRSNVVLRWEVLPGSSVFAIWQQNRWGYEGSGEFVRGGALLDALADSGENLFTVKFSYRLRTR